MKIQLHFAFQNNSIPKNYRSFILSYLKHTLSSYDKALYEKNYSDTYSVKNYCFSTYLKNAAFTEDTVTFEDFSITLSVADMSDGIDWYNAFLRMRNQKYPLPQQNSMWLTTVRIEKHREIRDTTILVKMLSPIAVRMVTEKKSQYYSCYDEEFIPCLRENMLTMLEQFTGVEKDKIPLAIEAVKPKKTVTYAFGSNITANLGIYKITSDTKFLKYLYELGIGSRRSEGFGMFEIIG